MKISTREMIQISLFTALTAIGAFISIPLATVNVSLQSLFTILAGLLLGAKLASLSQIVYILLGLAGIRIFSGFSGGPQSIFKPSFGFLIGFIFAAYIVGKIVHYNGEITFRRVLLGSIMGTLVIYAFGIPYMYMILNLVLDQGLTFSQTLKAGFLVFIPGDLIKILISSIIGFKILKRMPDTS